MAQKLLQATKLMCITPAGFMTRKRPTTKVKSLIALLIVVSYLAFLLVLVTSLRVGIKVSLA